MALIDLSGRRFNDLVVIQRRHVTKGRTHWECLCQCGATTVIDGTKLKSGHTKSCGCRNVQSLRDRALDLTGQVFGRLTAVCRADVQSGDPRWVCRCECGQTTTSLTARLRNGHVKSCGCLVYDAVKKHGHARGSGSSPEYMTWQSMIDRTSNPNHQSYKHYGGRGIGVDPLWRDFRNFLADMGPRPSLKHSIDRINNNVGYSKDNCRWATQKTQMSNTRRTQFIQLHGQRTRLADACILTGVKYGSVYFTIRRNKCTPQAAFDYHLHRLAIRPK
jgi:hypothetical protein